MEVMGAFLNISFHVAALNLDLNGCVLVDNFDQL